MRSYRGSCTPDESERAWGCGSAVVKAADPMLEIEWGSRFVRLQFGKYLHPLMGAPLNGSLSCAVSLKITELFYQYSLTASLFSVINLVTERVPLD